MNDFYQQIFALSPEQRALFKKRLKQRGLSHTESSEIPKRKVFDALPLSFAQQRLWFIQQLDPNNSVYNILSVLHFKGQLKVTILEQTFNEIVRRHEIFRTTFATATEGHPIQVIASTQSLTLPIVDLKEAFETEKEIQRLVTEESQRPFDLTKALLRLTLLRLGKTEHILLLTMHHIISDRWSMGVLVREMKVLYEAFSKGQPSPLPELPIQYADWAIWQQQYLQGEVLEAQLKYWQQQLGNNLPILDLPTDRPRPAIATYQGARQPFELPKALSDALMTLSVEEGVTLFTLLLAAFKVLLHRYTDRDDIIVGTDIANRNRVETEGLIGFLINTLVLRTKLSGNPTFRELLSRVREVTLGAYAHQDLSFEKLVEILNPERSLSQMVPLFQVKFDFQLARVEPLELSNLTVNFLPFENRAARFELRLNLLSTEQGLRGEVEYSTHLFNTATITRMMEHFQILLEGIVTNPEQRLSELPLLTKAEQHQLLAEWNDTRTDCHKELCIHNLFEAQVERSPDAVAVSFEDQHLTYRELNNRANQLGYYLQSLGVRLEVLVGICMERSLEIVVGILSILKAGGAYVPLDPAYPQERLAFMLQNAQVSVLLTQQHLIEILPKHQTGVVCIDAHWESIAQENQENLISGSTVNNLAYVIYTSGSTGQPKGVLVNHVNVVRLFYGVQPWYHFNEQDVWTLFHSIAFDVSVWELWGTLLYGGRLVVVPYWLSRSPEDFYKLLYTQQVTVLNQTPSAFRQLMQAEESLGTAEELSLRLVIFAGEALDIQSLRPWFERYQDQFPQLVNMYGITETTVHTTIRPLTMTDLKVAPRSVIGRSIPGLQIYVLDQHQQLVPIGVPGEIHVGGTGLARGYLNRSDLTACKFIPNPYNNNPNARLYRSGDLARYLPNGDIEYLRRIDHQVKVRGFRIELGEIENALTQHQAVREAVVVDRETQYGDKQLVGYVVPNNEQTPMTSDLRNFLLKQLPEYMVPSVFVLLEALPLTPNGKVDRRVLPAPTAENKVNSGVEYVPPQNEIENILTNVWQKVLGVATIGILDNYFFLGGDSIRVIQIVHALKKYNLSITVIDVFQNQTIYELAQHIFNSKNKEKRSSPPLELIKIPEGIFELVLEDIEDAYPLSQMQELMLFHYSNDHQKMGVYHIQQSFHIYDEAFSLSALKRSLEILVHKHSVLRTVFITENLEKPIQIVKKKVGFSVKEDNIKGLTVAEQEDYIADAIREDRTHLFDIKNINNPLFRFRVFIRTDKEIEFFMSLHHAIEDGWGNIEFLNDLLELYSNIKEGKEIKEITSPNVYKEFIALEQEILLSKEAAEFWKNHLKKQNYRNLQKKILPIEKTPDGNEICILDSGIAGDLHQLSKELSVSLKAIFLSTYLDLIGLETTEDLVTVGVVSNGRSERLSNPLKALGLFWNMVPFCHFLESDKFSQIRSVQQLLIEIEPYIRYPLAQILADQQKSKLFFATFNFLHFHNRKEISVNRGLRLLGFRGHDKFHFPLNYVVSVSPGNGQVSLRVEYDRLYFTGKSIRSMTKNYIDLLAGIIKLLE